MDENPKTPKVLYQTYKSRQLTPIFAKYHQKWKEMLPEYNHVFLTDDDLENLVSTHFPKYLNQYKSFTHFIERVDFARYIMMWLGGVYADLDTYPLKHIDPWVTKNKIVLGREPLEHSRKIYKREIVLCNAFMISPPNQQLWIDFMDYIVQHYRPNEDPVYTTGPMAMTKFFEHYPHKFQNVIITDPCVFFPMINDGTISKHCNGNKESSNPLADSYVVHAWENSWTNKWYNGPTIWNVKYWFTLLFILVLVYLIFIRPRSSRFP